MKLVAAAALAAVALVTIALSGVGRPDAARGEAAPDPRRDVVTVNGTGKVESVPDRAEASFGVVTRAETAEQAVNDNAERMRRVIDALRDAGVADKDIRTQELALMPHYDKDAQAITGYEASNTVVASSPLDKLGAALDDARAKAEALAEAGGFDVGDVVGVIEGGGPEPVPMPYDTAVRGVAQAERTPLMPGTQEIQATVSVSFAIG